MAGGDLAYYIRLLCFPEARSTLTGRRNIPRRAFRFRPFLDASNNLSNIVTPQALIPTAGGTITDSVNDVRTNNSDGELTGFYYPGAFRLTTAPVPEPSAALLFLRRCRRAAPPPHDRLIPQDSSTKEAVRPSLSTHPSPAIPAEGSPYPAYTHATTCPSVSYPWFCPG